MRLAPTLVRPLPRDLPAEIDLFGSGRAARAMLTVAALSGHPARIRVWCRHEARAELLRVHLADLPPLDAGIVVSDSPPDDGRGPLVLALGARTSRRSRQSSKDALFAANMEAVGPLMPALAGRSVIVVTNPSTLVTARLAERGVNALGVGVMNDQLRFERDGPAHIRLAGAHNPFELAFGALGQAGRRASPSAGRPIATSPTGRTGNGRCSTRTAFSRAGRRAGTRRRGAISAGCMTGSTPPSAGTPASASPRATWRTASPAAARSCCWPIS